MACIRRRRRRWVLDYRDATGRRRWETFDTRRDAEDGLARALPASRQRQVPTVDPNVTVRQYAERWLQLRSSLKPRSLVGYREKLELHILPALGSLRVRKVHRSGIKTLLAEKQRTGLAVDTVRLIHASLRAMLNAAVDDGVIQANPAAGLGRSMSLTRSAKGRQERIRAFDGAQLDRFLAAAQAMVPRLYPLFFLLSRTGLRLGEALALRWADLDLVARELRVERALSTTRDIDTPKSGHGRTVDLGRSTCEMLRRLHAAAAEEALARGARPEWVFPAANGPVPHVTAEDAFKRALRAARLPEHFSPHSLRHTYASLLLADGVSPAYVQEQLGHASIDLTVGTYGRWLRKKAPGAVDRLDEVVAERAKVVAAGGIGDAQTGTTAEPQDVDAERTGGEGGIRTPGTGFSPVQQISNLPCSATPAPLRNLGAGPNGTVQTITPWAWRRARDSNPQGPQGPGAFKAPALPVRLALRGRLLIIARRRLLGCAQVGLQPLEQPGHELGMAPPPAVLDVQVHHGPVDPREAQAELGLVAVLLLAHHEDAVGPEQEVTVHRDRGKGSGARRADLVPLVALVEVLGGPAAVHVGRTDKKDALAQDDEPPRNDGLPF
jgi:integrase